MSRAERVLLAQLLARTRRRGTCRLWTGATSLKPAGRYPYVRYKGRVVGVCRVVYELVHGTPLTPDQDAHHVCVDSTLCIEPSHIQAVRAPLHRRMTLRQYGR